VVNDSARVESDAAMSQESGLTPPPSLDALKAIVRRHAQQNVMPPADSCRLLLVEDAAELHEELQRVELRWLVALLQVEGVLPGDGP